MKDGVLCVVFLFIYFFVIVAPVGGGWEGETRTKESRQPGCC